MNNRLAHGLILQTYKTELSQARQDGNGLLYYHDSRSWNRHETVYYNQWVVETIVTTDFRSLNDNQKKQYWEWRHKHDHDHEGDHDRHLHA